MRDRCIWIFPPYLPSISLNLLKAHSTSLPWIYWNILDIKSKIFRLLPLIRPARLLLQFSTCVLLDFQQLFHAYKRRHCDLLPIISTFKWFDLFFNLDELDNYRWGGWLGRHANPQLISLLFDLWAHGGQVLNLNVGLRERRDYLLAKLEGIILLH